MKPWGMYHPSAMELKDFEFIGSGMNGDDVAVKFFDDAIIDPIETQAIGHARTSFANRSPNVVRIVGAEHVPAQRCPN